VGRSAEDVSWPRSAEMNLKSQPGATITQGLSYAGREQSRRHDCAAAYAPSESKANPMIEFSTNSTAADFAKEYLRLGGKRKVVTDDNKISIRLWDDEPEKAEKFWAANIQTLERKKREEVETLLPSINDI
jgi:hypothetical protein